ncbi:lytic polysaccharide monooxygenase [Streptomyces sp. NPDC058459]|uniref:lytic polysaccharide monooxygenase auxiliary activity family 9 protein n=1 Tax=Streptomyces sp. NPDC058459 TaxID=3346508 RepID=UPI0036606F5E
MTRMTARLSTLAATAATPLLLLPWTAAPAQAHGAPVDPVSRVYACSPQGGSAKGTPACQAAIGANGAPFTAWDNLRVSGVGGRDRQVIPDGRLCSGNLPAYRGLDLARTDWPATRLTAGSRMTLTYASTIAHEGTFRLYLTKSGYDPAKPLKWYDLPERPFAEIKNPPLSNGAYHLGATLPTGRTGRQLLYTIWQNTSTPDTYYSCSDVVLSGRNAASGGGARPAPSRKPAAKAPAASPSAHASHPASAHPSAAAPASEPRRDSSYAAVPDDGKPVAEATRAKSGPSAPLLAGGAAVVLLVTAAAALVPRLRRR